MGTAPGALGRPAQRAAPERRDEVLHYLRAVGPQVGVPTLASLFPDLARRELEELKLRFRRLTLGEDHLEVQELEWVQVGAVWAMDFTQLEVAIDGVFPFLLSVRDLASGYQLMALPAPAQDAELVVVPALTHLFQVAGAPLVLKNDNGGPLVAEPVQLVLETHQVVQLRSPPYTPEYNGACEAGIGQFKTHAHYLAAAQGGWTSDVAEAARQQGNRIVRASGQSAEDAWDARRPLAEDLRSRFRSSLRRLAGEEWTARGEPAIVHPNDRDALDRLVIGRALIEHDLLRTRRRRIPLPKSASFRPVLS